MACPTLYSIYYYYLLFNVFIVRTQCIYGKWLTSDQNTSFSSVFCVLCAVCWLVTTINSAHFYFSKWFCHHSRRWRNVKWISMEIMSWETLRLKCAHKMEIEINHIKMQCKVMRASCGACLTDTLWSVGRPQLQQTEWNTIAFQAYTPREIYLRFSFFGFPLNTAKEWKKLG